MGKTYLAFTIGNDPHTEGLFKSSHIGRLADIQCHVLEPGKKIDELAESIKHYEPDYIGISYRLTPEIGVKEFTRTLYGLKELGLLYKPNGQIRKIALAGLPKTIEMLEGMKDTLPCEVYLVPPKNNPLAKVAASLDYFEIYDDRRKKILSKLREELFPYRIKELDQLAKEVISGEKYRFEPPLNIPSDKAKVSFTYRHKEAERPLIRTHFGIPSNSIYPTVEGIKILANAKVVDEISLGSSDLSQRYFGRPDEFKKRKNDGGVPYKDYNDLVNLFKATRQGNYPSIKPYAHVYDILNFIDICIKAGMLVGAHQAIPLFWFNELDGRGPLSVSDSINEHILAVKKLAKLGIPVEMNDPNQWSSRYAHDTLIVTDYALITAVMVTSKVKNRIYQFQFNKPAETGDLADLAKMSAAIKISNKISQCNRLSSRMWKETRTGIEHLSSDMETARYQLARSTLLQMYIEPQIIHLVSYCEANHAATPEDIIESSQIVRRAVKLFEENKPDLIKHMYDPVVLNRKEHLINESSFLLKEIAKLNPLFRKDDLSTLAPYLVDSHTLIDSMRKGYMAAPGIMHPDYRQNQSLTKPMEYGFIDVVDFEDYSVLSEESRLNKLIKS